MRFREHFLPNPAHDLDNLVGIFFIGHADIEDVGGLVFGPVGESIYGPVGKDMDDGLEVA